MKPKPKPKPRRKPKPEPEKRPPSRFAPSAFLSGSPEAVQALCQELAELAAERFQDLTGSTWQQVGEGVAAQLRSAGHDLSRFDESESLQEWQAHWHHPRGTFSLFLSFQAPSRVEVSWKTETQAFVGRDGNGDGDN